MNWKLPKSKTSGVKLPSITLITFANQNFNLSAETLCRQASKYGFAQALLCTPDSLNPQFTRTHSETFSHKRGAGYWLWKPFVISECLRQLSDNDILLYLDAGILLRKPACYFRELAQYNEITLWQENSGFESNNYWVDEKVWWAVMGSDKDYRKKHFNAGAMLIRNSKTTRKLISDWLDLCKQPHLLHPDSSADYQFKGDLIGHRHDQSLLNCILYLNRDFFNLMDQSNQKMFPFLIHRRGNVRSLLQARFLQILRVTFRFTIHLLPKRLRVQILIGITKKRKPTISEGEIIRHKNLFFS
jgi:hypothetical protein